MTVGVGMTVGDGSGVELAAMLAVPARFSVSALSTALARILGVAVDAICALDPQQADSDVVIRQTSVMINFLFCMTIPDFVLLDIIK